MGFWQQISCAKIHTPILHLRQWRGRITRIVHAKAPQKCNFAAHDDSLRR